ncbi:hypothetical protein [Aliiglaciecola lipolytica]|uniref:hypothetical protein n=1 Tax=Aliiglaciecola lipolytica TaxID=477689 RepID=UPI001C08B4C3|nr:hypothetical protein [Aliiglaciecola lipolytica]MBU2876447.1 hypothetical protein [Aliiglaciecola lipolytica]
MIKWISSLFSNKEDENQGVKSPYAAIKVCFDEKNVWVHWPEKEPQSIAWNELIGVAVETTDEGPFVEDVWWHLATKDGVITYPSEATGAGEFLRRLQDIPTFNNERLIKSMSSTENQTFILWDHEGRHE